MNDTTRTYPRTMREAFPFESQVIEHFPNHGVRLSDRAVNWALLAGAIAVILAVCFGAQS